MRGSNSSMAWSLRRSGSIEVSAMGSIPHYCCVRTGFARGLVHIMIRTSRGIDFFLRWTLG